mgnify:CR=1 FL=1
MRPIDAYTLNNELVSWYNDTEGETEKSILRRVMQMVVHAPTLTPPNEALTMGDAKKERYIWFTPLNDWAKVTPFGVLFFGSEELMTWETLCEEWGYRFKAYRRPPEGEA